LILLSSAQAQAQAQNVHQNQNQKTHELTHQNCATLRVADQKVPCYLIKAFQDRLQVQNDCVYAYMLSYFKGKKENAICLNTSSLLYDQNAENLIDFTGEFSSTKRILKEKDRICILGVQDGTKGDFLLFEGFVNANSFSKCASKAINFQAHAYEVANNEEQEGSSLALIEETPQSNPSNTSICFRFNYTLKSPQDQSLNELVDVQEVMKDESKKPIADESLIYQIEREQLCVLNLKPKQNLEITINDGLKGTHSFYHTKEKRLVTTEYLMADPIQRKIQTPGLKQRILLSNQKYIMPGDGNLFIRYYNTEKVEATLYAVDERNFGVFLNQRHMNFVQEKSGEYYNRPYEQLSRSLETEIGSKVWQGVYELPALAIGQEGSALLPIKALSERKNALFLLLVKALNYKHDSLKADSEEDSWGEQNQNFENMHKTQWILFSKIGLYAVKTQDQLEVKAINLNTLEPISDLKVQLIAKNNRVLSEVESNGEGKSSFPIALLEGKNADQANIVLAKNEEGEISILDLDDHQIAILDENDQQSLAWQGTQAFVTTDRGAYRPSETVSYLINLRNAFAKAVSSQKLLVKISKANGDLVKTYTLESDRFGLVSGNYDLEDTASTGQWQIEVFDLLKTKEALRKYYEQQRQSEKPNELIESSENDYMKAEYLKQTALFKEAFLGKSEFKVDFFLIPNLKVDAQMQWVTDSGLANLSNELLPPIEIKIKGEYLHGALAKGLKVQTDLYFRKITATTTALANDGYVFGDQSEKIFVNLNVLPSQTLDEKGEITIRVPALTKPDSLSPRELECRLTLTDINGASIEKFLNLPVSIKHTEIGIKGIFDRKQVIQGDEAIFKVLVTNHLGEPQANQPILITWQHLEEIYDYSYFWDENNSFQHHLLKQEKVTTDALGQVTLKSQPLLKGYYAITATHLNDRSVAIYRFMVSDRWFYSNYEYDQQSIQSYLKHYQYPKFSPKANDMRDQPLALKYELAPQQGGQDFKMGDTLKWSSDLPTDGYLRIWVMGQKEIWQYEEMLGKGKTEIEIPTDQSWQYGVHLVAVFIRNGRADSQDLPRRLIAQQWLMPKDHITPIEIAFENLAQINRPLTRLKVDFKLQNLNPSESDHKSQASQASQASQENHQAEAIFWLVDEAVLQLTSFQMKDLFKKLIQPKQLSLIFYDAFQHILENFSAPIAKVSSGGDMRTDQNHKGLKEDETVLALQTGVLKINGNQGSFSFDLPDFNGQARLMGYVFSKDQVGQIEKTIQIKQQAVIQVAVPRYLSKDETALGTLKVMSLEGDQSSTFHLIAQSENLELDFKEKKFDLKPGEQWETPITVKIKGLEDGFIHLKLKLANGEEILKQVRVQARAAWPYEHRLTQDSILPREIVDLDLFEGEFESDQNQQVLTISSHYPFDVQGMMSQQLLYPYGCGEQIISKALPLLEIDMLKNHWPLLSEISTDQVKTQIQKTIDALMALQDGEGAFAYWRNGYPNDELTVYALQFLLKAKSKGFEVPANALASSIKYLSGKVGGAYVNVDQGETIEWFLYLQAIYQLSNKVDLFDALQKRDLLKKGSSFNAKNLKIALLYQIITQQFSENHTHSLPEYLKSQSYAKWEAEYLKIFKQIPTVELLKIAYLLSHLDSEKTGISPKLLDLLMKTIFLAKNQHLYSTSERTWLILTLGIQAKKQQEKPFKIKVNGKVYEQNKAIQIAQKGKATEEKISLENIANLPLYYALAGSGLSKQAPKAIQNRYQVKKKFFNLQGIEISESDLQKGIERGKEIIVDLIFSYDQLSSLQGKFMLIDLLSSGTAIQGVLSPQTLALVKNASQNLPLCSFEDRKQMSDRVVFGIDGASAHIRIKGYDGQRSSERMTWVSGNTSQNNSGLGQMMNGDDGEGGEEGAYAEEGGSGGTLVEKDALWGSEQVANDCHYIYVMKTTMKGDYLMPPVLLEKIDDGASAAMGETGRFKVLE
jgi:uncharacterized protein YfaS (alpha-2-macroglobulin family)